MRGNSDEISLPPMLEDYRHVATHHPMIQDNPIRRGLRALLESKPGEFADQMNALERQWLQTQKAEWEAYKARQEARSAQTTTSPSEPPPDDTSEQIEALITRLLEKLEE